jgi:hypothetical protein
VGSGIPGSRSWNVFSVVVTSAKTSLVWKAGAASEPWREAGMLEPARDAGREPWRETAL